MQNPTIYIILPVHNRLVLTVKFIDHLLEQEYKNYKLILVDDGSTDGTAEMVLNRIPDGVVLKGDGNLWWGGSLQTAYDWISQIEFYPNDLVLIINDDTKIEPNFLLEGVSKMNALKRTIVQASAYDLYTNNLIDAGKNVNFITNQKRNFIFNEPVNCLSTRGLFLNIQDFINIKGFYPKLIPHYGSDYEYTIRAWRKGYTLICFEEIKLWYDNSTSGIKEITNLEWSIFWKDFLSKRCLFHPIYAVNYFLIAFPFPYNLIRAFRHVVVSIIRIVIVIVYNMRKLLSFNSVQ